VSDSDKESNQPIDKISIIQKIGIFVLIPVFVVISGFIIYDKQLANPGVIAATAFFIIIIFLAMAYLFIRKLVTKRYQAYFKMQLMAITDELTQLFTRDHFNDLFQNEMARAIRHEKVFCCALLEIDGFKEISEKYGSQFSDELLQDTAESLRDDLRVIDILARDDDRFICLFPETDIEPALFVSKRLRSVIEGETFETGGNDGIINITISIGITESNPSSDNQVDILEIIDIADKALTIAKEQGGNRVEYLNNTAQSA
jgi:diguanylate cyclase (GGDEF)-like protein